MIASKTSTTSRTITRSPVSSSASRAAACRAVSPGSIEPPGRLHSPCRGARPRRTSSTSSPRKVTTAAPATGLGGGINRKMWLLHAQPSATSDRPLRIEDRLQRRPLRAKRRKPVEQRVELETSLHVGWHGQRPAVRGEEGPHQRRVAPKRLLAQGNPLVLDGTDFHIP